jgi:NADH dehydrogenase
MGRYAGYNVISDLMGAPMLSLRIPWYVTVLDLGPAGAVYTEGWDRRVVSSGAAAKATKRVINGERIYPPLTGDRAALLAAAAPELQAAPDTRGSDRRGRDVRAADGLDLLDQESEAQRTGDDDDRGE